MLARLRQQQGFGLIELMMALTMLNIGLLAVVAAFTSGTSSMRRANRISTAAAAADAQMELYRAITWPAIAFDTASDNVADGNAQYNSDPAWTSLDVNTSTCPSPLPAYCLPIQTVVGADHESYLLYTYITTQIPPNGRQVKLVTVVVRDGTTPTKTYLRVSSTFDQATGK